MESHRIASHRDDDDDFIVTIIIHRRSRARRTRTSTIAFDVAVDPFGESFSFIVTLRRRALSRVSRRRRLSTTTGD